MHQTNSALCSTLLGAFVGRESEVSISNASDGRIYIGYYYHTFDVPISTASMRLGPLDAVTRRQTKPRRGCIVNCDVVQRANTSTQQPH